MKTEKKFKNLKESYNSIVSIKNNVITLTYDLGSLEDSEIFDNKFKEEAENFNIEIEGSIINDPSYNEEEDENGVEWYLYNATITFNENTNINKIKEFIDFCDTI